jgi:DNA (cytosine-5)-methyltransferase 1
MKKHLGLFEGIGGFSLAARWMGWETSAWCEINPFCQKVLKYHFPEAEPLTDIKTTDFTKYANKIDILTGGFPCQPFSSAGKRKGIDDDRYLWPEMLRAIREIKPVWVVGENVRGLVSWNGGLVFDEVQAYLEAEGYEIIPFILPACAVNAPHKRERVWFIAYSDAEQRERKIRRLLTQPKNGCNKLASYNNEQYGNLSGFRTGEISQQQEAKILRHNVANTISFKRKRREDEEARQNTVNRNTWSLFPTQSPVCSGDDGVSRELDGITFSKWRNESIKAYGNAIVPQVALQIFKAIEQYNNLTPHPP